MSDELFRSLLRIWNKRKLARPRASFKCYGVRVPLSPRSGPARICAFPRRSGLCGAVELKHFRREMPRCCTAVSFLTSLRWRIDSCRSSIDRRKTAFLVFRLWDGVHLHAGQYMGMDCLSRDEIGPEGMMRGNGSRSFSNRKVYARYLARRRESYDDGLVTAQFEINSRMGVSARCAGIWRTRDSRTLSLRCLADRERIQLCGQGAEPNGTLCKPTQ